MVYGPGVGKVMDSGVHPYSPSLKEITVL